MPPEGPGFKVEFSPAERLKAASIKLLRRPGISPSSWLLHRDSQDCLVAQAS